MSFVTIDEHNMHSHPLSLLMTPTPIPLLDDHEECYSKHGLFSGITVLCGLRDSIYISTSPIALLSGKTASHLRKEANPWCSLPKSEPDCIWRILTSSGLFEQRPFSVLNSTHSSYGNKRQRSLGLSRSSIEASQERKLLFWPHWFWTAHRATVPWYWSIFFCCFL